MNVLEFLCSQDTPLPDHDQIEAAVPEFAVCGNRKYAAVPSAFDLGSNVRACFAISEAAHAWRTTVEGLGLA